MWSSYLQNPNVQTSHKQWLIFSSSFTVSEIQWCIKLWKRNKKDFICLTYLTHTTAIPCDFASWALLKVYWCKTPVTSELNRWVVGNTYIRFLANYFFSCNNKNDNSFELFFTLKVPSVDTNNISHTSKCIYRMRLQYTA